ncbi:MAG: sugar transferase [Flavobacteriaceae bacterium]|nr:sugar transferase [Flavobacteriaceae bacterium]MBL6685105.1 sugar transferase [Flavobacteriaceae bacterium]
MKKNNTLYLICKRVFDMIFSFLLLVVLFLPFVFIGIMIKLTSKGPILYSWKVVGKDGDYFNSFKFRTMVINADKMKEQLKDKNEMSGPFFKIEDDPRVTRVGKFLRKYSIDELPQFISVFLGSMSIVGPRPPLQTEYVNFTDFQKQKLSVKPGITCLWQVQGRNNINDANEWIKKDLEYISKRSFIFDIKIIVKTIFAVFRGTGK